MEHDDLVIPQGTTWSYAWPITENGQPVDLTGWSAHAQIRADHRSQIVIYDWSTAKGNADLAGSQVMLHLNPADSSPWEFGVAVYDVELTDLNGNTYRVAEGSVTLDPEVTR